MIVLDIMMPEMDASEACKAIRANATTSTIPVIFLTAKAGEIDEILGLERSERLHPKARQPAPLGLTH